VRYISVKTYLWRFFIFLVFLFQVIYICQLHKDVENEKSFIFYISEFALKEPLLSFSIHVAKERKEKVRLSRENSNGHVMNGDDGEEEGDESLGDLNDEVEERQTMSFVTLITINKR